MQDEFVIHDPEFKAVLGHDARLTKVADTDAHEGPVYVAADHSIYFTAVPRDGIVAIKRLDLATATVHVLVADANHANGMTLDADGCLIVCEQGNRIRAARLSRRDRSTGRSDALVEAWRGLPFNSPNDVVVKHDGTVWFTDPSYGYLQGFRPEPRVGDFVYRYDPTRGDVAVVADDFCKPNGIAFSPDEQVLYVSDSGANQTPGSYHVDRAHHVIAYDVVGGRHLHNRRLFAVTTPGYPDGLKVDCEGRVYASSFSGVQVLNPEGDLLGEIALPGAVNFTFGGRDGNQLFITNDSAVWFASLDTKGATP